MTAKELRRLSKTDLITLLRDQEAELQQLKTDNAALLEQLEDRTLRIDKCGSIADAALALSGVFEATQSAANQYLASVQTAQAAAQERAQSIEEEAQRRADALLRQAETACREKYSEATRQADAYWGALAEQLESFYRTHVGLREMLAGSGLEIQLPKQEDAAL